MEQLSVEEIKSMEGKTWLQIFQKYDPDINEYQVEYLLWNATCYPFDNETTIKQIHRMYQNKSSQSHDRY